MQTKICATHNDDRALPVVEFAKNRHSKDGLQTSCRACMKRFRDQWYTKGNNLQLVKDANVAHDVAKRLACLQAYSKFPTPKCECCQENQVEFLTLDRIKGAAHPTYARIKGTHGSRLYRSLVKLGFPSGFRVLCNNCNFVHWLNGGCPHQNKAFAGYVKSVGRIAQIKRRQKTEVITHYGGECACCHENEPVFLTVDHMNRDGHIHRQQVSSVYQDLIRRGFPEGYQVLCWNCNQASGHHSTCPHQNKIAKAA